MSTFGGKIEEICGISIDQFENKNWDSTLFLLSHCHYDHMKGFNYNFIQHLIDNQKLLYTSEISAEILKRMYVNTDISKQIHILQCWKPTLIELNNKYINISCIPAGHCPGSVMFLIESDKTILYTGDYRLNPGDIKKFKLFYNSFNHQKNIYRIYLDTTFFLKEYLTFPTRDESLNEICSIISKILKTDSKVHLIVPANYGYESLFIGIYKLLKIPIHISDKKYQFYKMIPEMDQCITMSGDETSIHCGCGDNLYSICEFNKNTAKKIKITAMRWHDFESVNKMSECDDNYYYVCFSTHASYRESAELIKYFKPKIVSANVWHDNELKNIEIRNNIQELIQN